MTDRAFMSSKQLYVEDRARESYQSRLRSKVKSVLDDKDEMADILQEALPLIKDELTNLAREFDGDDAFAISELLQMKVYFRAKSLTPESIEEDYE